MRIENKNFLIEINDFHTFMKSSENSPISANKALCKVEEFIVKLRKYSEWESCFNNRSPRIIKEFYEEYLLLALLAEYLSADATFSWFDDDAPWRDGVLYIDEESKNVECTTAAFSHNKKLEAEHLMDPKRTGLTELYAENERDKNSKNIRQNSKNYDWIKIREYTLAIIKKKLDKAQDSKEPLKNIYILVESRICDLAFKAGLSESELKTKLENEIEWFKRKLIECKMPSCIDGIFIVDSAVTGTQEAVTTAYIKESSS